MADISGKKIAIVVDNYFEEAEFSGPLAGLRQAGGLVDVIGLKAGDVQSMNHADKSKTYPIDKTIDDVDFNDYDALVLPGGGINADSLRMNQTIRAWVKEFMEHKKPVAAICHAPWVLASAEVLEGRKLTSYSTIQDDLRNAGAEWTDEAVVIDGNLITSRQPDDVPAFNQAIINTLQ